MKRPVPPPELRGLSPAAVFAPSPALDLWARATFIADTATARNPEHAHLQAATLGFVWTSEINERHGRRIMGQCEIMPPMAMGKWQRARARAQVEGWFGLLPDFLITIDAQAAELDDASFMALIEHELYHAAQATDIYGAPKFDREGNPVWTIRGHDVEQFVGVVRRYGPAASDVEQMVRAANKGAEIAPAKIAAACGTCHLRRVK